jgi:hypothetical protein
MVHTNMIHIGNLGVMRTACELLLLAFLLLVSHLSEVRADGFALLESHPAHGQVVTTADLRDNPVFLKFNHPVDRSWQNLGLVRILDKTGHSLCQFNICGVIHLEEDDTKLIWHPQFPPDLFQPGKFFEIHIGDPNPSPVPVPPSPALFRDVSGNTLAVTNIDFSLDPCQPIAGLKVTDNNVQTLLCSGGLLPYYAAGSGYGITLRAQISNPICGSTRTVEGKVWLKPPDGSLMSVFDPFTTVSLAPGDDVSVEVLHYTFVGNEPGGNYEFGFRLLNPVTGDNYSAAATGFSFGVCPYLH